jgi:hypothetical protein
LILGHRGPEVCYSLGLRATRFSVGKDGRGVFKQRNEEAADSGLGHGLSMRESGIVRREEVTDIVVGGGKAYKTGLEGHKGRGDETNLR